MERLARLSSPVALATGLLSAAGAVAVAIRGPVSGLDAVLTATAVFFLATGLVGRAALRANPRNVVGWILLIAGAALPVSVFCQSVADAAYLHDAHWVPVPAAFALVGGLASVFAVPVVGLFGILLFPDGRLTGPAQPIRRRTRWLARACVVDVAGLVVYALLNPSLIGTTAADVPSPIGFGPAGAALIAVLLIGPIAAMACLHLVGRARTAPATDQRKALTLAARAAFVVPLAFIVCLAVGFSGGDTAQVGIIENVAAIAIALAAWVGIIRYGLFDRRAVLSRTLLYGGLTLVVVAVYAAASAVLDHVFAGAAPAIVAAALGALAVLPLRDVLQHRVNRLVYGLRDDPGAAFGLLRVRLEAAAVPEDVLPAVVRTVGESLRLRFVAIEVDGAELARWGEPVSGAKLALDLPFGGEAIGQLTVQASNPDELFSIKDRSLLEGLASQVSVAARAVALTNALQAARERLVATQEEERRRLRRDLHDGLGPTLAGIALGIDTARRALPDDAAESTSQLLASLRQEAENAVADIRRIAYDLRPPILDEMGLVGAIAEHARRVLGTKFLAPEVLPALPAAVEVAAYRIAIEAMTNAMRHAPGAAVEVTLSVGGSLELEISDDGAGMPLGYRAGIGVTSMRDRAAELGGSCVLDRREPHGTVVRARLPLIVVPL
jgi:two-component system, NarL family, sensor kinase